MENITGEKLIELQKDGNKILVDFWAKWCGPCKSLIPRLESIEKEYENVKFVKIDVDENSDFASNMGIRSIPTVMFYRGQDLINRTSGLQTEIFYKSILDTL
jgi:thioredoxin 1